MKNTRKSEVEGEWERKEETARQRERREERGKAPMVGNGAGRVPITTEMTMNPDKITGPEQEESRLDWNTREQNELTEWGPIS